MQFCDFFLFLKGGDICFLLKKHSSLLIYLYIQQIFSVRSDDYLSFKKFGPFVWLDLGTKPFAKMFVANNKSSHFKRGNSYGKICSFFLVDDE